MPIGHLLLAAGGEETGEQGDRHGHRAQMVVPGSKTTVGDE